MVEEVLRDFGRTRSMTGIEAPSAAVQQALGSVPRERFVPRERRAQAWHNRPVGIGQGQTISQPYIVALMTELLGPLAGRRVLEIGTGSGYQAAVLAALGAEVWSVEILPELSERAGRVLHELGVEGVHLRVGDGADGWPEEAPFDGILVTCAAPRVPPVLRDQLASGGRMVVPVGPEQDATLLVVERLPDGEVRRRPVLPVSFVPMTGSLGRT
ncbi:MAG: protein-L-isoaspartate(D-aspartate) O-methyltransferase [Planctomycetota bacterium]